MRFFFRTKKFKIIASVFVTVLALAIVEVLSRGVFSPENGLISSVVAPIEKVFSDISAFGRNFSEKLSSGEKLINEKAELEKENEELKNKLADYEETVKENEFLNGYLGIKAKNPDFAFCPAKAIAKDPDNNFKGFTVNKGSLHGISLHDPVICDSYLVGYVSYVGLTTSKVTTILSPSIKLGAYDSRTSDTGVASGDSKLALDGLLKLYNLNSSADIAVGDFIVTSGEGIFPSGILVGEISGIKTDSIYSSLYAEVLPFADFDGLTDVMIITDFIGQGGLQ